MDKYDVNETNKSQYQSTIVSFSVISQRIAAVIYTCDILGSWYVEVVEGID